MKYIVLIILLLPIKEMNCQITNTTNTMGILYSEPKKVGEGYLLFVPLESQIAYLNDNCGIVINTWTFEHTLIHSGCYLLEDGSILKLSVSGFTYEFESYIERRSWDNELVWQYSLKSEKGKLHSDLHILPNGNILVLKEEKIEVKKAISLGVNPNLLDNKYNLETLIELKPIGVDSATIVWQWRLEDRLVQEYDDLKDNYGIVADFPRKYNANLYNGFTHFNSIDYNKDAGLAGKNLCGKDVIENENTLSEQCIEFWRTKLSFSYTMEGKKVAFTLTSTNIGNLVWNFGDGNTAMEENPVHIFEMLGTYEVCLSGSNCYGNDSYCDNIEVSLTNTDQIQTSISFLKSNII